ncbi:MAG: ABC transporter substrate-binding protein [Hyphomicrobiaceae bacterium]|nr:ABC transporter substrate-binding protein [Hyphomicrobiaceae bacterium]
MTLSKFARTLALSVAAACSLASFADGALAAKRSHGLSIFGELKYGPDFKHFDYVNPNAPKGGSFSTNPGLTFDSFNPFILTGDPEVLVTSLTFDTLMVGAGDEADGTYGLVAHSVELADDKKSVTFFMRPEAKFSDGSSLTAEDVVFTLNVLKTKGHPRYRVILRDVVKAEALDKHTVRYTFKGDLVRDLPLLVASLPILSKAYYDKVDFTKSTLVPPLGSGPYILAEHQANSYVVYRRRKDYWAKDLPVNRGRWNFDEMKMRYYADRTAAFEAFKSGEFTYREEFTSKRWATEYEFPAIKDGRVIRETLRDANPSGTQGWFVNVRRSKFSDPRLRKALDYAFDFKWSNKHLFYGLYERTESYFENSDMRAVGKPSADELALLEPFRSKLPKSVFGEVYTPPVSDASGRDRKLLREAHRLMNEAGFKMQGGKRIGPDGKPLTIEFLRVEEGFDRIMLPFIANLKALGVDARIRPVDAAQYERRLKSYDFDIIIQRFVMSKTPGVELLAYFSSKVADTPGSRNLAGIKDPVVDALISKVMSAGSRKELDTAVRAIDRVLRAGHYWVPQWYKGTHNIAYWNVFSRPAKKPAFSTGVFDTWWYDAAKAAKTEHR